MTEQKPQPTNTLPVQAQPIDRTPCAGPAAAHNSNGVEAAKTQCSNLTGPARQMCYSHLYGFST